MESERDRKVKEITNLAAELSFWNKIKVDISEQSGKPTLKEFPTSPYVYHFHPIAFVEQMKRGETKKKGNCFCDRDITVEELKTIVKNIRDNTYYENKTITSYHKEKLFYLYAKVPVSDQTFEKFAEILNKAFKNHGITKCSHKIHFLANMYVETMYFTATREGGKDLRYDPYRGRGFQHLTWKTNYEEYEKATGVKIVTDYEKVADDLGIAADTGAWYWKKVKANEYAEKDSIFDTSRLINLPSAKSSSSINGFKNREIAWKELKKIFKYPQQCSNVKQPTTGSENIYDIYIDTHEYVKKTENPNSNIYIYKIYKKKGEKALAEHSLIQDTKGTKKFLEFPITGNNWGRYGVRDTGKDNWINEKAAAAFFGFLYNLVEEGISDKIYFDDISGYDGKDIGHKSHRKGEDIDVRYPGTPTSKRFWYDSTYYNSSKKDDKILVEKLEKILEIATNWKFTKNYVYKSSIKNATYAANHEHHFHIGHRE